jgi:hypothetical protein
VNEAIAEVARIKSLLKRDWKPETIMDFASDYGWMARHLPGLFPDSMVSTSDFDEIAVAFNQTNLELPSFPLPNYPDAMRLPAQDVILAIDFFPYLSETAFLNWIKALASALAPGGALIFTTNGLVTEVSGRTGLLASQHGFGFLPRSAMRERAGPKTGINISQASWVMQQMASLAPDLRIASFRQGQWWSIQDSYIYLKEGASKPA